MLDPGTAGAIAGFLAARGSSALDALLKPSLSAAGETLLDRFRSWRAANAAQVVQQAEQIATDTGYSLGPVSRRVLMPILEYSSLEEDDSLRIKWAALLANAASPRGWDSVLPAYGEILRQLTPIHAGVLDSLYSAHGDSVSFEPAPIADEYEWRGYQTTPAADIIARFELTKQAYSVLASDLHRLQVIDGDRWSGGELGGGPSGPTSYDSIHITPLGRAFVRACARPKA